MRIAAPLVCAIVLLGCSVGDVARSGSTPAASAAPGTPDAAPTPTSTAADVGSEAAPAVQPFPSPTVIDAQPRPTPSAAPEQPATARYAFPVRAAASASYGREHHDYPATDIFAPCGTTVVAPVSGTVEEVSRRDVWDPEVDDGATRGGKSISIIGDDGVRYYGSHFSRIATAVRPGQRIAAGDRIGAVGRTGSARQTPCHLHFGISPPRGPGDWEVRRGVVFPWPFLDSWREGGQRSPARAVRRWARNNP